MTRQHIPKIEIHLNEFLPGDSINLELSAGCDVLVYIPLDSFGVTNSHIDICDDLLEAIWSAERLAANASEAFVLRDYQADTHKTRFKLLLHGISEGLPAAIRECAILYNRYDETDSDADKAYSQVRDTVLEFEDELDSFTARLPEIVDDFFANLVGGAYYQMRYDAPDRYEAEMAKYPERRVGYWRSPYSQRLGATCYASPDGWLLDKSVELDQFFAVTGQKFKQSELVAGNVLTVNSRSYVLTEGMAAYFPMAHYFKSRICASFARLDDDEHWPPDTFEWADASFSYSPHREYLGQSAPECMRAPPPRVEGCLIDTSGRLIIVDDGHFRHLLYDTKALNLDEIKSLFSAIGKVTGSLGEIIGLADNPSCEWGSLSDEQFEQLCYDVIYNHPLFNAETIRKYGKSRSRDGGRDIEVYDIPRIPGAQPRKWIFQCKLVTGAASLSATKLIDVGDMFDHYGVEGFGVMTSAPIDATLYDKLDAVCGKRKVQQMNFSVLELERELLTKPLIRQRYFQK
ncbi:hypothetical protein ACCT18_05275 [Rhizobium ruizarguesonis]